MVSDSPGLVDFAIGLVNSVFNLPDGQVIYFEEFEKQKNCEINSARQRAFGLVEMTSGLVNVRDLFSGCRCYKGSGINVRKKCCLIYALAIIFLAQILLESLIISCEMRKVQLNL